MRLFHALACVLLVPVPFGFGGNQPATIKDNYGDPLPPGVIARLGTLRLRVAYAKAVLSQDGTTIITANGGKHVKYWDAENGKLREMRELPVGSIGSSMADQTFLSADGRVLAVQRNEIGTPIDIWDITSSKRVGEQFLPRESLRGLSPDGKTMALGKETPPNRGLVRLWEIGKGERQVLKGHTRGLIGVAFSPDGKLVATADGALLVCWNVQDGRELWRAKHSAEVFAFTRDNQTLIGAPDLGGGRSWQCWDAATGQRDESRKMPEGMGCMSLAVSPDNWTIAFSFYHGIQGVDARVRIWDMRTGSTLRMLPTTGMVVAYALDGKSIYTNDGALQRWELATGRPLLPDTGAAGHRTEVFRVIYSRDGRLLATSAQDGTIRIWDKVTAKALHIMHTGKEHACINLAFTSDATRLLSGDTDGDLHVWDTKTGNELRRITLHDEELGEKKQHVHRLSITPDDRTAMVLGNDPGGNPIPMMRGTVSCWDLATGRRVTTAKIERSETFYTAFSPDGLTLASQGELIETATGKSRVKLDGAGRPFQNHHAFSPDGRLIVGQVTSLVQEVMFTSIKVDGTRVWDSTTGKEVARLPTDWVGQYAFTPDARYLAAADIEGIRLWELLTGTVVLTRKAHDSQRGSYGASFASCMCMAPDGHGLATGHPDGTILIWSLTPSLATLGADDLLRLWTDMVSSDSAKAYTASWQMAQAPDLALSFLRKRVQPATAAPAEQTGPFLTGLDSQDFKKREESVRQLRSLSDRAAGALRQGLKSNPSLETRLRLEGLLKELKAAPSGEALGALRAVTVLERIGTWAARELLGALAEGDTQARLTQEAKMSLQRLSAK